MKQLLIEIDDETAARLDQVAPARSRRRLERVRGAIRRALWELEERRTEEAYRRLPDNEPAYFAPEVWDAWMVSEAGSAVKLRSWKPRT